MNKIAVLIACFNRKEETLRCLSLLYKQIGLGQDYSISVYLLDDDSTDGTSRAVSESYPQISIIKGNGKLFWSRGMHIAWKHAATSNYDFYLWLNNDVYLYDYALQILLSNAHQTNNQTIICGSTESPKKEGLLTYGGGKHQNRSYEANYPNGSIKECDIINGNCVLVPQFVYNRVGNLDWQFIHSIADNDYSLRAKSLGILSYTASHFLGCCARQESLQNWCQSNISLLERIKHLYSPLGNPPGQYFIFEIRHYGFFIAFKHYLSTHLRVLIPSLWNDR